MNIFVYSFDFDGNVRLWNFVEKESQQTKKKGNNGGRLQTKKIEDSTKNDE